MARAQLTWGAFGLGADDGAEMSGRNCRGANGSGGDDGAQMARAEMTGRS